MKKTEALLLLIALSVAFGMCAWTSLYIPASNPSNAACNWIRALEASGWTGEDVGHSLFEVIYIITAHESPECVKDMVRNILHFNRTSRVGIVINGSPEIQADIMKLNSYRVRIMQCPTKRKEGSFDILNGYLEAGQWCRVNGVDAEYVILLASNCMFWKEITLETVSVTEQSGGAVDISKVDLKDHSWHWPSIYANRRLVDALRSLGIENLQVSRHEGTIYKYHDFMKITSILRALDVRQKIDTQTVFEEFLLASIYARITGRSLTSICRVFWDKPNVTPTIEDIKLEVLPCVKRVVRKVDDSVRMWLRDKTSNYHGSVL